MYIELFLLDNLLMNLLIVRCAAALLSVRPPLYRQFAAALLAAGYAAAAAYLWPVLASPLFRLPLIMLGALALPFADAKGYLYCCAAMLAASAAAGGTVLIIALLTGGGAKAGFLSAGIGLRAALSGAAAASLLPYAFRRLLARRTRGGRVILCVTHKGITRRFAALVDTGNLLHGPVSGLPVVVLRCPAYKRYAMLGLAAATAAGKAELCAFRPQRVTVNGVRVECLVALADDGAGIAEALIPPELCPEGLMKGTERDA